MKNAARACAEYAGNDTATEELTKAVTTKLCSWKGSDRFPTFPSSISPVLVGIYSNLCVACQTNDPYTASVTPPKITPITTQAHRSSSCGGCSFFVRFLIMQRTSGHPIQFLKRFAAVHRYIRALGTKPRLRWFIACIPFASLVMGCSLLPLGRSDGLDAPVSRTRLFFDPAEC
jgi:hypothetical protein